MTKISILLAASALAMTASSAHAAFTVQSSMYPAAPVTSDVPVLLSGITGPSQAPITGSGYTVAFSGITKTEGVLHGTSGQGAVPVAGVGPVYLTGDFGSSTTPNIASSGNYLSTGSTGDITIGFTKPQTSLELLWGSIDAGNELQLFNGATPVETVIGSELGMPDGGYRGFGGSAYVYINGTGGSTFTSAVLSSTIISFEAAGIVASTSPISPIPEPVSLALLGGGLAAVGAVRRMRR